VELRGRLTAVTLNGRAGERKRSWMTFRPTYPGKPPTVSGSSRGIDIDVPMSPGRSFASCLDGETLPDWDGCIFHEFENTRMVRTDRWKFTWRNPEGPNELYDVENDPGESENKAGHAEWSEEETDLRDRIAAFFDRYADPQYDLWKSGRSKAGRLI